VATKPILLSYSAGTKPVSLVFAYDLPHKNHQQFAQCHRLVFLFCVQVPELQSLKYHTAVFAMPLTLFGMRPWVAVMVPPE